MSFTTTLQKGIALVDWNQKSFLLSAASIAFNPIFWNIAARQEYHNRVISRLFGGNRLYGCYALAVTIFSLGIFRDFLYERALRQQPTMKDLDTPAFDMIGYSLLAGGNVLVLTSMWALGITGTYLGDYFGILMDKMVTGFPFNVTGAPMYYGSFMSFLGSALLYSKPAGVVLSLEVIFMYMIALQFEDPFTAEIYAKRERERSKGKGKKSK